MTMIDATFWQARWDEGKIGFHEGKPNAWLARRVDVLEAAPGEARSILVPLAGKAVDVAWLAARGHRVVACEIVPRAVDAFFADRGIEPVRGQSGAFERVEGEGVVFLRGDVFDLRPEDTGPIDAVYDRAALIALPPALRSRYLAKLAELAPGGRILLVGFEHGLPDGPPFDLTPAQVDALFAPLGHVEQLGEDDLTESSPQFTSRGAMRCLEAAYRIDLR